MFRGVASRQGQLGIQTVATGEVWPGEGGVTLIGVGGGIVVLGSNGGTIPIQSFMRV